QRCSTKCADSAFPDIKHKRLGPASTRAGTGGAQDSSGRGKLIYANEPKKWDAGILRSSSGIRVKLSWFVSPCEKTGVRRKPVLKPRTYSSRNSGDGESPSGEQISS